MGPRDLAPGADAHVTVPNLPDGNYPLILQTASAILAIAICYA